MTRIPKFPLSIPWKKNARYAWNSTLSLSTISLALLLTPALCDDCRLSQFFSSFMKFGVNYLLLFSILTSLYLWAQICTCFCSSSFMKNVCSQIRSKFLHAWILPRWQLLLKVRKGHTVKMFFQYIIWLAISSSWTSSEAVST